MPITSSHWSLFKVKRMDRIHPYPISVRRVRGLRVRRHGNRIPASKKDFLFSKTSRPPIWPPVLLIQWVIVSGCMTLAIYLHVVFPRLRSSCARTKTNLPLYIFKVNFNISHASTAKCSMYFFRQTF